MASKIRISIVLIVDILLAIALILIYNIDQMVNGTLYYYGLIADIGWMEPYRLLSRISAIAIILGIFLISAAELPISAFRDED
jgi:hypothetical protein